MSDPTNLNIITTWDECAAHYGETKTKQMDNLNAELKARYSLTQRSRWRLGKEPIPMKVYDYLITECLPYAIEIEGGECRAEQIKKYSWLCD